MIAELWGCGTVGIIEETQGWRAFFADEITVERVQALAGLELIEIRREEPFEASAINRPHWDPIEVGKRFVISSPFLELPPESSRIRLDIDSPRAFGTGRHETTQLCLRALEEYVRPEWTVLDVGCGSGILSTAARLLGARQVFSCDIDHDALATSRKHGQPALFQGSADAVGDCSIDLTIANITASVLDRLARDLRRVTKPDGKLLISGFVAERLPTCFEPEIEMREGDWLCWICRPDAIHVRPTAESGGLTHRAEWWV